jgi:hypothetical protein
MNASNTAADSRPAEIVCHGAELFGQIADIERAHGAVESISTVPGDNSAWRLRIFWPRPSQPELLTIQHRKSETEMSSAFDS